MNRMSRQAIDRLFQITEQYGVNKDQLRDDTGRGTYRISKLDLHEREPLLKEVFGKENCMNAVFAMGLSFPEHQTRNLQLVL